MAADGPFLTMSRHSLGLSSLASGTRVMCLHSGQGILVPASEIGTSTGSSQYSQVNLIDVTADFGLAATFSGESSRNFAARSSTSAATGLGLGTTIGFLQPEQSTFRPAS